MWHETNRTWELHDPRFAGDELDPERAAGPWFGHRWFAYDLLRYMMPDVVVELGSHYGVSFFSFCQAVKEGELPTRLYAVDTWQGDPHAGEYGPEVLEIFDRVLKTAYPEVDAYPTVGLFSKVVVDFADESIDLLHIDGYHSYEAAKEDFEMWLPKLAPNGVVLMHDVAPETGYGSADYWRELAEQYPSFSFPHSFGLGVVFPKGTVGFEYLFSPEFARWRAYYPKRAHAHLYALQVRDQASMIDARDETIRSQAAMIDARDETIRSQAALVDERDDVIRQQDELLRGRNAEIRELGKRVENVAHQLEVARRPKPASLPQRPVLLRRLARRAKAVGRRVKARSRAGSLEARRRLAFDDEWYLRTYADVAQAGVDPYRHYVTHGAAEGRDPSPFFAARWYLEKYPDVAAVGMDPLVHFLTHGWREGRDPSALFNTRFYLKHGPGENASSENPLLHYLTTGIGQGYFVSPEHRRRVMEHHVPPAREATAEVPHVRAVVVEGPAAAPQVVPLSSIERVPARLLTLDVWDSLVFRTRPADSAKLATARRQFLRLGPSLPSHLRSPWDLYDLRVRAEADLAAVRSDEEYTVEEALDTVYREAAPDMSDAARDVAVKENTDAEWRDEMAATVPARDVWSVLARLARRPDAPALALVSDFYFGADRLKELLGHHGWPFPNAPIFVSCEQEASKRLNGSVYALVRQHFGVSAEDHVHLGDNPHADADMQLMTGGRSALLQLSPRSLPPAGALAPDTVAVCWGVLKDQLSDLAEVSAQFHVEGDRKRRALSAGILSAPLAVAVVARAVEVALSKGLDRVHYLSREGSLLAQVHQAVAAQLTDGVGATPRAIHLEMSRRSTFGPSLQGATHEQMRRMWRMYGAQSPRALLVSIGASVEDFTIDLQRHSLSADTVLPDIAGDARVQSFLDDPRVAGRLERVLSDRRERLLGYLRQETDIDAPDWVVVDIGWRGSIQDNLAHVLPNTQFSGVYLGLFPFLNPQPGNVSKEAVGFDGNEGDDFAYAEPPAAVERPWTPHVPSTVDYRRDKRGFVPVHDMETSASPVIDEFQRGLLTGAPLVAEFMVRHGFTVPMLVELIKEELRSYYEQPSGGTADIWFDSDHDDTFGALNVTPFGKNRPTEVWLGSTGDAKWAAAANNSRWEPGFSAWLPVAAVRELRRMIEEVR